MKTQDDLFSLVKRMSPSEKRYFKLNANQQVKGKQNSYVSLFDALDQQKVYDEKKLLQKLKPKLSQRKFASIKNYLYHAILKSLNAYNAGDTISFQIQNEIRSIHTLLKKDQLKKAIKHCQKARQMAWTYEKFELLLELLVIYDKLIPGLLKKKEVLDARLENHKEKTRVLEIIQNREAYRLLIHQVFDQAKSIYIVRSKEDIEPIEAILAHPILQDIDQCKSFTARFYFLRIQVACYYSLGKYEEQLQSCKAQFDLFQEHPSMIDEYLLSYVKVLFNLVHTAIKMQKTELAQNYLKLLKQIPDTYSAQMSFFLRSHLFETSSLLKMQLYAAEANYSDILRMVPEVEQNVQTYKAILESDFLAEIWFTIAKSYFHSHMYDEALKFTSYIMDIEKSHLSLGIFCHARLLRLMVYWEQRDWESMVSSIRTTTRFLQKHDRYFQPEKLMLKTFSRLAKSKSRAESAHLFHEFEDLLNGVLISSHEKKFLELLDIRRWVKEQYVRLKTPKTSNLLKPTSVQLG